MMTKDSDNGLPLETHRRAPASGGAPKQLVVLMHGVGADGADLIELAPMLAGALPDAEFLAPDAPFPCDMAPMGRQWFSLREMTMDEMLRGARAAEPILGAFLDQALEARGLGAGDLAVIGFSQGTMMALHALLRRPEAVAAIVGFSGLLIAPEVLPAEIKSRPPVLLVHGTADQVVPFQAMDAAKQALRATQVPVEAHHRPGVGHGIDPEGIMLALRHLQQAFGTSA
jgi:phospholipase/carboxylesterase